MSGTKQLKILLVPTLITLVTFVILFRLGWWQLERAEQKQQEITKINSGSVQDIQDFDVFMQSSEFVQHSKVKLSGSLLEEKLFFWDNRVVEGVVGYEVLALLETNFGLLPVNLGWIPAKLSRAELPDVDVPIVFFEREAVLFKPSDNVFITETLPLSSNWPKRIQQPDTEVMAEHLGRKVLPFVAYVQEEGQFRGNFTPVVMPPEKHIAYAIQWFGLALAVLVVFYFAVKKKLKNDSK